LNARAFLMVIEIYASALTEKRGRVTSPLFEEKVERIGIELELI
jgi:hypothetical protein